MAGVVTTGLTILSGLHSHQRLYAQRANVSQEERGVGTGGGCSPRLARDFAAFWLRGSICSPGDKKDNPPVTPLLLQRLTKNRGFE